VEHSPKSDNRAEASRSVDDLATCYDEPDQQAQIRRFDVALNNLTQGVCFFDGSQRLILANRRYAEIYGLSLDSMRPGMMLADIVDQRYRAGTVPHMTREEYLAWRAAIAVSDKPNDTVVELKSGQVISIHHRPLPDGGWVSTHEDITERREAEKRMAHMARHDPLTGLPNRVVFREYVDREPERRARGDGLAVLCIDLDRFKYVNDTFGHAAGDALLCTIANRLSSNVREHDVVVRLGGDEFAVLQIGVDQPNQAMAVAQRLIEVVSRPVDLGNNRVTVGASVGIAYSLAGGADAEMLLKSADMALYQAKAAGRGTFHFFNPTMNEEAQNRYKLEMGLRSALANGELELHFQPIVNAQTEELCRFEALLRWRHPERGLVQPSEFIPLAEEIGVIVAIGEWVLQEACRLASDWPDDLSVSVNLSVAQLMSPNLVGIVRDSLRSSGLRPSRLELEITETVLLENANSTLETLWQLRDLGLHFALDDFGTGYSSIGCLRTFPFNRIKIDRSFIRDLGTARDSVAIVHAIIDLSCALGMSVTAEGVETAEQLRLLRSESCSEVQGHLFSAPVPADQVPKIIDRMGSMISVQP
jgi:diguanylate cyclase (GGDEF)-like protein